MKANLKSLLCNRFAALLGVVFLAVAIAAPDRGPTAGLAGRLFMAFWCASGLTLAALHLFKPPAARIALDALFTLQGRLMLFGEERDAFALSNFKVRTLGLGLLVITSLGFYDVFFR